MTYVRPAGSQLTAREIEVIKAISWGAQNQEVARQLNISVWTVKSHLRNIAFRLGTGDRAGMVAAALRAGVIE